MSEYMYYTTEDKMEKSSREVRLSQLVVRGHLNVLKYLYEKLNYHKGLQRYCRPAIQYGELEILKWLDSIGCMNTDDEMHNFCWDPNIRRYRPFSFCYFAVQSGNVEVLEWFVNEVFEPGEGNP
ncbi:predicted protein [Chaetoceros tenuissimus]|uniref:Ankyrin repeat protein n=1 Tax=Chaetoceros tenuissimus TaxID=426638 RepID=A0AAD3HA33_9STRA|nr:predicted protein [Chaetoceros tenuissimus]